MAYEIGYVDDTGGVLANQALVAAIRDLAVANGWSVLRWDTSTPNHELILRGTGLSGDDEIFVGFRSYQSEPSDYYNMTAAAMTGYVPGNPFDAQPGGRYSAVPLHNQRIDYWLTVNAQRIALAAKVGTPVYESCYVGYALPYGRPSQYPYPIVCAGMLSGSPPTRYSEISHSIPYKGNRANMALRTNDGWVQPHCYPWNNQVLANPSPGSNYQLRDTGGNYLLIPVELNDGSSNLWGSLDGVFYISGFNNGVENTVSIAGETYVVIQDVWRTGFIDYYALRLDS